MEDLSINDWHVVLRGWGKWGTERAVCTILTFVDDKAFKVVWCQYFSRVSRYSLSPCGNGDTWDRKFLSCTEYRKCTSEDSKHTVPGVHLSSFLEFHIPSCEKIKNTIQMHWLSQVLLHRGLQDTELIFVSSTVAWFRSLYLSLPCSVDWGQTTSLPSFSLPHCYLSLQTPQIFVGTKAISSIWLVPQDPDFKCFSLL